MVIVDAHRAFCSALCGLFEHEPGVDVVCHGERLSVLDEAQRRGTVDAVLVDDGVAGVSTARTRAALQELSRRAAVVVIGMGDPVLYGGAAIGAGAVGYWPKYADVDVLMALVQVAGTQRQPPGSGFPGAENGLRAPRLPAEAAPAGVLELQRRGADSGSSGNSRRS